MFIDISTLTKTAFVRSEFLAPNEGKVLNGARDMNCGVE